MRVTMNLGCEEHCVYCGAKPDTKDHVIPVSFQSATQPNKFRRLGQRFGVTVASCMECNNILGSKVFEDFYRRCDFVKKRLHNKYKRKIQAIAEFDNEELEEYGPNLKKYLQDSKILLKHLQDRLDFQESYQFFLIIKQIKEDVSHEMFPKREFWMQFFHAF